MVYLTWGLFFRGPKYHMTPIVSSMFILPKQDDQIYRIGERSRKVAAMQF